MLDRRFVSFVVVTLVLASFAAADTKVVQKSHTDAMSVMGKTQPARDEESVMWIAADRMRMDQGSSSSIVRLDQKKMYLVDHGEQSYAAIDLPLDLSKVVPEGMSQMLAMMKMDVTVTPSSETRAIGEWQAARYDVKMASQMTNMNMVMWATTDVALDTTAYSAMYADILGMQPMMAELASEMAKIDGFVIAQESTMTMPMAGEPVKMSLTTVSIDELDAPAGTYEPPADYKAKAFDFMEMMQKRQ